MAASSGWMALAGLLLYAAAGQARPPEGWVISLQWSPEYCKANPGSEELQCLEEHYFELGTLQPRFAESEPPECQPGTLPKDTAEAALATLPNKLLIRKNWRSYGACSGLSAEEYFVQFDRARRRVSVPEEYRRVVRTPLKTTTTALRDAFAQANADLQPGHLAPRCKGKWLQEVQLCLDADFRFQACAPREQDQCPEDISLRPIKSSRVGRGPED